MRDYYKSRPDLPSQQISARIEGAYHQFLADYSSTGALRHSLSKGEQRENPIRDFFHELLPRRFSVSSGEVFDSSGNVSPQSDMIIYRTIDGIPVLDQQPTLLQAESAMCITEVKTKIDTGEYKDCLRKANKIFQLRPFGRKLQQAERGRNPGPEECRYFISIFAYGSDIKGDLKAERDRYIACANELRINPGLIDRIYILGKGIINPATDRFAADTEERKVGLFYFYSNLLQFATREAKRRKEVPYIAYFGKMSEGWSSF